MALSFLPIEFGSFKLIFMESDYCYMTMAFFFLTVILHYSYWIRVSGLTYKEHNYTRLLSSSQKTLWSQYHSLLILFFFFFLLSSYVRDGICVSSFRRGFRQWLRPSETNGCDSYLILVEGVTTLDLHFWWPRYLRLIISKEEIRREKVNKPTKEKNSFCHTLFYSSFIPSVSSAFVCFPFSFFLPASNTTRTTSVIALVPAAGSN